MAVAASLKHDHPALRPSLDRLASLVEADMGRVNELIVKRMHSQVGLIPELAGHIIAAGGKRLRPMLTLAASRLCGYEGFKHIGLAAAVEFIHTATLLHDDVVDESDLRRGLASANSLWGNKASVLVGDFLFSRAFELMVEAGSLEVLGILAHAAAVIAEGEVQQLTTSNDTATTEAAYLDVIRGKTAQLFAAAARVGAIVADRPVGEADALERYGMNVGIAFQLVDDVLDYSARQAELGKTVGDDFREGKLTLPVILAFERGDEAERAFWRRTLEELEQRESDLAEAVQLMERHQALGDAMNRARHYAELARAALAPFADQPIKRALLDAVDFTVERAY
ncbi:MAG: polyprenyl synthetase family protein [Proteobacteria bacterium]|nr:polyprenyl synthetase family protein [Pseudomonadota bacterium]MBI3497894.1 polyprenyl synthetase family protein [Pseudomonadota bacterium]